MRLLNKTLIKEIIFAGSVIAIVTIGIFIVIKFVELLKDAVEGHLPTEGLIKILALNLMTYMDIVVGSAIYIAVLIIITRWHRDRAIAVYATSGVSPWGFLKPACFIAVVATIVVAMFTLWVSPFAERVFQQEMEEFRYRVSLPLEEGQFVVSGNGLSMVYFAKTEEAHKLPAQFFRVSVDSDATEITIAESGTIKQDEQSGLETLHLTKGLRYILPLDYEHYETTSFQTLAANFRSSPIHAYRIDAKGRSTGELLASKVPEDASELIWRISTTVMIPIVIFLAFALSLGSTAKNRGVNIVVAIVAYFVYSNLLGFAAKLFDSSPLETLVYLSATHITFIALVAWLIIRSTHRMFDPS